MDTITPPSKTSSPLYKIGFESMKGRECAGVGSLAKTRVIESTISGTRTALSRRIFSMPKTTIIPPSKVIARPKASGMPVMECMIKSPPASIEQSDMLAARKMPSFTILPCGIIFCLPAIRNSAQRSDIKTDDIATLKGDASPKNKAISRPEEKPAPIAVPIYRAAVLNAFFT